MKFLFQNGKGEISKTATIYSITMIIIWVRVLFEGSSFSWGDQVLSFAPLDPMLVGALVAACGAVYTWRRGQEITDRVQESKYSVDAELKNMMNGGSES